MDKSYLFMQQFSFIPFCQWIYSVLFVTFLFEMISYNHRDTIICFDVKNLFGCRNCMLKSFFLKSEVEILIQYNEILCKKKDLQLFLVTIIFWMMNSVSIHFVLYCFMLNVSWWEFDNAKMSMKLSFPNVAQNVKSVKSEIQNCSQIKSII